MTARILVIEDNPANLALVEYLLNASGYITVAATDGATGVRVARETRPDLVICDLQMPGLSGYEVLEELRADPTLARTPVIAVTAFSMQDDQIKVLSAGFNGYLSKPIEPERFVAQVEEYLPLDQRRGGGVA